MSFIAVKNPQYVSRSAFCQTAQRDAICRLSREQEKSGWAARVDGREYIVDAEPASRTAQGTGHYGRGPDGELYYVKKSTIIDNLERQQAARQRNKQFRTNSNFLREREGLEAFGGSLTPRYILKYRHKENLKVMCFFPLVDADLEDACGRLGVPRVGSLERQAGACYALCFLAPQLLAMHTFVNVDGIAHPRAHCDVKAANVMVHGTRLLLADFGSWIDARGDSTERINSRNVGSSPHEVLNQVVQGAAALAVDSFGLGILFLKVLGFDPLGAERYGKEFETQVAPNEILGVHQEFEEQRLSLMSESVSEASDELARNRRRYWERMWHAADEIRWNGIHWGRLVRHLLCHTPAERLSIRELCAALPRISPDSQPFGPSVWSHPPPPRMLEAAQRRLLAERDSLDRLKAVTASQAPSVQLWRGRPVIAAGLLLGIAAAATVGTCAALFAPFAVGPYLFVYGSLAAGLISAWAGSTAWRRWVL